jgi:hypothetical protein
MPPVYTCVYSAISNATWGGPLRKVLLRTGTVGWLIWGWEVEGMLINGQHVTRVISVNTGKCIGAKGGE